MSQKIHETDSDSDSNDHEKRSINVEWEAKERQYEIVSPQPGGFDRVTRPDYVSAKEAAEVHERATGNFPEINLIG